MIKYRVPDRLSTCIIGRSVSDRWEYNYKYQVPDMYPILSILTSVRYFLNSLKTNIKTLEIFGYRSRLISYLSNIKTNHLIDNPDKIGTIFIIDFRDKLLSKITNSPNLICVRIYIKLKN